MNTREQSHDQILLNRLRAHDESAAADLTKAYGAKIYQLAFRYLRNKEDAEEVTQDVLLRVCRKADAFRGDAALSSWIYRITFNAAMSRLRSAKARLAATAQDETTSWSDAEAAASEPQVADWSNMADERIMRQQLRTRLFKALRELPRIYRIPVDRKSTRLNSSH